MRRFVFQSLLIACLAAGLLGLGGLLNGPSQAATARHNAVNTLAQGTASLDGRLELLYGDPPGGGRGAGKLEGDRSEVHWLLRLESGRRVRLEFSERLPLPYPQLAALRGERVLVQGSWQSGGRAPATFHVETLKPAPGAPASLALDVTGSQPWVSILCKFSDIPDEPKTPGYFSTMYSSSYPGLDHYWREASYDLANVVGSAAVLHWYTLPQPRAYYVYDIDGDGQADLDFTRATNDCTAVADPDVYYPNYVGINLMFNGDLDGYAWGGGRYLTVDGVSKLWYMTWEPPWGYQDITVIEHEMGHGFGLPHSSGEYGQVYDNRWDVMSDAWSDCANSSDPTYGCLGQGTISYHKDIEGWLAAGRRFELAYGAQAQLTLEQLALPQSGAYLMARIPIGPGGATFYSVEARRKTGYDVKLPGQGVIIHQVDPNRAEEAHVKDSDGNGNTGDAGAIWTVGETFNDAANGIWVRVDSSTSSGFVVTISNNYGQPTFTPTPTRTPTITPTPTLLPGVYARSAWTADGSGNTKTSFNPGEAIRFYGETYNNTGAAQSASLHWYASGPCGVLLDYIYAASVSTGTIYYYLNSTLPSNPCGGVYTYQFSVTYNSQLTSASTNFTINSPTPTNTATITQTPTATLTRTPTPTVTQTHTPSPTATATQTHTPSPTATSTGTHTATPTSSQTPTSTQTLTPTLTRTATLTQTPSPTATTTATPTITLTPTATSTTPAGGWRTFLPLVLRK